MFKRVQSVLESILEQFKSGTIPQAIHYSMFPIPNIPSSHWSLLNRLIMFYHQTNDARGYRQWQQVKRQVLKGKTSFDIIVPILKKELDQDQHELKIVLKGFCCGAVFRVEDTAGEPLDYQALVLPKFPLIKRAKDLGIKVKAIPGNHSNYGYFNFKKNVIAMATSEESVFFHELCHAADYKLNGKLKAGQDPLQEITAELAAHALCRLIGKDGEKHLGNTYRYIEAYAKQLGVSPYQAVLKVLTEVDNILRYLLLPKDKLNKSANKLEVENKISLEIKQI